MFDTRLSARLCGLVGLALLGGCGDDLAPRSPAPSRFGYDTSQAFPREACVPGSLAALTPAGLYHAYGVSEGLRFDTSFRIDGNGAALTGAIAGVAAQVVRKTRDDLLVRAENATTMRAVNWCGVTGAGELVGSYVRCTDRGCLVARLVGRQVVPLQEAAAHNVSLLGETDGAGSWDAGITVNVRVRDGLAYLARYGDGLRIVDVHDPAAMRSLGHVAVEFPGKEIYNDVKIADGPGGKRYALLASNVAGVVVIDVSAPTAPFIAAHFGASPEDPAPNVHTLAVDGGRAYLANTHTGLEIFDVAQPLAAVRLGHFTHPANQGYLHDLHVVGTLATLNWWDAGMAIVDVSAPATPRLLGTFTGYGEVTSHSSWILELGASARSEGFDTTLLGVQRVALHGDEQYGAHLNVVDITEGSARFATSIGSWSTRPEVSIHNVMAMGNLAIIAYYHDGLRVVDVSTPATPVEVAWFNTWQGPAHGGELFYEAAVGLDIDPSTRTIYVADSIRGLLALRLASGI